MVISKTEPKSTTSSKDYYYVFFSTSKYQTSLPIISTYVSIINQGRKNERKCNFTKTTIIIEWMDFRGITICLKGKCLFFECTIHCHISKVTVNTSKTNQKS
jgi:hypothetical protein